MGGVLSNLGLTTPTETADRDRVMAALVIPVCLEKNLALADGSTEGGCPISEALKLDQNKVSNLYTVSGTKFQLSFQEHGVAYNESAATDCLVEAQVELEGAVKGLSVRVDPTPVQAWGLNFAGRVLVKHAGGEERVIYLPGTRTYDPAGLTGERSLASCVYVCMFVVVCLQTTSGLWVCSSYLGSLTLSCECPMA